MGVGDTAAVCRVPVDRATEEFGGGVATQRTRPGAGIRCGTGAVANGALSLPPHRGQIAAGAAPTAQTARQWEQT
ncbi:hypothetical protein [Millisia brevis]|uniref:hypothetical protein n=1 Tax=Millisia brevis TaxID=264148 RepID=UPI0014718394|nr:hypothetical protein [Millisia brevis]